MAVRPRQATEQKVTLKMSTLAMNSMLRMAIAKICYNRGLLDASNFVEKVVGGASHQMLRPTEHTEDLLRWMREGVAPALEKQYLDELLLIISADEEAENVLEVYSFKCAYDDTPQAERKNTDADGITKQVSAQLAQLGAVAESTSSLPSVRTYMRIELVFNERTPDDYSPPACFSAPRAVVERTLAFATNPSAFAVMPVRSQYQSVHTRLYTTQVEGVMAGGGQLGSAQIPLDLLSEHVPQRTAATSRARGSEASPSSQLTPTSAAVAIRATSARERLTEQLEVAKRVCLERGYGAHLNAEILVAAMPGLQTYDALKLLCMLEQTATIGPFSPVVNSRIILAGEPRSDEGGSPAEPGASDGSEEQGTVCTARAETAPPLAGGTPEQHAVGGRVTRRRVHLPAGADDSGNTQDKPDEDVADEPSDAKRPRRTQPPHARG